MLLNEILVLERCKSLYPEQAGDKKRSCFGCDVEELLP